LADMLGRLISHNDLIPLTPSNLTRFHSRTPPNISLSDYLRRIVKYTSAEKSCLLILLIYIDRICESHPHFTISSLTVHRFLITAVTVSSKALCDSYCTNSHYAKVGGLSTQELNALELEFLALIDWHLASSGLILQQYYANLVQQHPCY
ncbi:cyclin, partial [Phycomyces blakesleeanus NRRL 1555(-)]